MEESGTSGRIFSEAVWFSVMPGDLTAGGGAQACQVAPRLMFVRDEGGLALALPEGVDACIFVISMAASCLSNSRTQAWKKLKKIRAGDAF